MSSYARNNHRADVIRRFGETADLPLFKEVSKPLSPVTEARFKAAPKAIPTGAETRRLANETLRFDQLRLSKLCQQVWNAFAEFGPASNSEIAQYLHKESGWVSARNNDLRELKLLADAGKRKCNVTGNVVTIWRAI